ncbi:hypothetical protein FWC31_00780 [Candidatus Saccharibacteria bacterium]|nr:hypothetical protein [Candidatus Saccharibacteria bacterium]
MVDALKTSVQQQTLNGPIKDYRTFIEAAETIARDYSGISNLDVAYGYVDNAFSSVAEILKNYLGGGEFGDKRY